MTATLTHEVAQLTTTEPAAPAARGPLGRAWNWMRRTVQEMNYAAGRVVNLRGTPDR